MITLKYINLQNQELQLSFSKHLLCKNTNEKSLFVMEIQGSSMEPLVLNKSLVILDLSKKELILDSLFLIALNNEVYIKKYIIKNKKEMFVSINESYKDMFFMKKDIRVIAKAVLTFSRL